ncbi:MAG: hypothetical protein AAF310_02820 [Myxococcota bacterium]
MLSRKKVYIVLTACLSLQACGKSLEEIKQEIEKVDAQAEAAQIQQRAQTLEADVAKLEEAKSAAVDHIFEARKCMAKALDEEKPVKSPSITNGCSALEIAFGERGFEQSKKHMCNAKKKDALIVGNELEKKLEEIIKALNIDKAQSTCVLFNQ